MFDIDITVETGRDDPLSVPVTSVDVQLISGGGRLLGWSLREASAEIGVQVEGNVLSPGALATIVATPALAGGTYDVNWTVGLQGAPAAIDANNFQILNGAVVVSGSANAAAAGEYPQQPIQIIVAPGATVSIQSIAAGTVGVTYSGEITLAAAGNVEAVVELRSGNQVLGEASMELNKVSDVTRTRDGVPYYAGITLHVIKGTVTGTVYARYGSP